MHIRDILSMAVRNLLKRKLRTFLTVLGVIIGVVSIVMMRSLGEGINMNFNKQFDTMGDLTIIEIYNWQGYNGEAGAVVFDDNMIAEMSKWDGVDIVTPYIYLSLKLISGRYSTNVDVIGLKPEALEKLGYTIAQGESLHDDSQDYEIVFGVDPPYMFLSDLDRKKQNAGKSQWERYAVYPDGSMDSGEEERDPPKVDVLRERITGSYFYEYGNKDVEYPNGKKPDVYNFQGVGILEKDETKYQASMNCFMDINKALKIEKDSTKYYAGAYGNRNQQKTYGYQQGYIKCKSRDDVEIVMKKLDEYGFQYYNPMSWITTIKEMTSSLEMFLLVIGAVALFVATIGIANTMIMSMYERTKEIGIMKVIGAALKDIKRLFLLEAAIIGLSGGIIGLGICYGLSYILNNVGLPFLNFMMYLPDGEKSIISYIPVWLSGMALAVSACVGLVAGYFPARRATKLSALTAIKTE